MTRTRIVNCRSVGWWEGNSNHSVYIGRGSKWGNPFVIGKDGTREEVIEKYRAWVVQQKDLMASLQELYGKVLVCYCKPLPCHGDVLVDLLEKETNRAAEEETKAR